MNSSTTIQYLYIGLLTLVFGGLAVAMFLPYLSVILLAAVVAVMLEPLYRYIRENIIANQNAAAGLIVLITLIFILIPLSVIGLQLFREVQDVYMAYKAGEVPDLLVLIDQLETFIQNYVPGFTIDLSSLVEGGLGWVTNNVGAVLSSTIGIAIDTILFVFTLFFFLRDGDVFARWYKDLSPLTEERDQHMLTTLKITVNSVIRGTIFIAIIQGVVAGIGFVIFGIPNVLLWGTVSAFSAIVPGLGVGLVFIPMIAYLAIGGHLGLAIGLALWGSIIVGLVDNALVPYFYSRGLSLHPMFILFAVLGGVALIGPFGFIFGPLVLSVVASLARVYMDTHDDAGHSKIAS